jgi:hypothetical protein
LAPKLRRIAGSAFVVSAALLGFLTFRPSAKPLDPKQMPGEEKPPDEGQAHAPTLPQPEVALTSAKVPSASADSKPAADDPPHPHPITPQHERIYRENNLSFSLDGAVDAEDAPGIRRLLAVYREEFPEDSLVLQQGYEIIADCLERPGEATRAAAQRFYDTELASALRRHVRRHCLDKR